MLLRVEDLSGTRGLKMTNAFMIGSQIFGVDQWLDHDWQMYTVDAETFAVKKMLVEYNASFIDVQEHSRFRIQHPIAVYGNAAYCWSKSDCSMVCGGMENGKFHWKMLDTNVPIAMREREDLMRFSEGATSIFTVIVHSRFIGNPHNLPSTICQLDLETMQWTEFLVTDHKVTAILNNNTWHSCYIWTINRKVHIILPDEGEAHLILDNDTGGWTILPNDLGDSGCDICTISKHFIHYDKLYKFERNTLGKYDLLRFDDAQSQWIKVCNLGDKTPEQICLCTSEVVVRATRVFLFSKDKEDFLNAVSVIEMSPTLFDCTVSTILRDELLMRLAEQFIPRAFPVSLYRDTSGDTLIQEELSLFEEEQRS